MATTANKTKGLLVYFPEPILHLHEIAGEPTTESLIDIHRIISGNADYIALNFGGRRHGHLAIKMTTEDYLEQVGHVFVPPRNHFDYPPMMGTPQ